MEHISKFFVSTLMVAGLIMSAVFLIDSFNDLHQAITTNAVSADFINQP